MPEVQTPTKAAEPAATVPSVMATEPSTGKCFPPQLINLHTLHVFQITAHPGVGMLTRIIFHSWDNLDGSCSVR